MRIVLLDAHHVLYEGVVSQAIVPGADGELSFMDDHEPLFAALTKGFIRVQPITQQIAAPVDKAQHAGPFFIHRGIARMKSNELIVLVE